MKKVVIVVDRCNRLVNSYSRDELVRQLKNAIICKNIYTALLVVFIVVFMAIALSLVGIL